MKQISAFLVYGKNVRVLIGDFALIPIEFSERPAGGAR